MTIHLRVASGNTDFEVAGLTHRHFTFLWRRQPLREGAARRRALGVPRAPAGEPRLPVRGSPPSGRGLPPRATSARPCIPSSVLRGTWCCRWRAVPRTAAASPESRNREMPPLASRRSRQPTAAAGNREPQRECRSRLPTLASPRKSGSVRPGFPRSIARICPLATSSTWTIGAFNSGSTGSSSPSRM